jgi:hypothetical protein
MKRRVAILAAVTLAAAGAAAAIVPSGPRIVKDGTQYRVLKDGVSYTFDAAWRVESLRAVKGTGPVTDADARTKELRGILLRHLKVESLEKIPLEGEAEIKALEALGYI